MQFGFPRERTYRVIINTDAKNEADDQFAIVHALLTPSLDICGIVAAHFGERRTTRSMEESYEEVMLLLGLMEMKDSVRVEKGASHAMAEEGVPVPSDGARLIVEEAMKDDPRPLYLAFLGPLTDLASALLIEPRIADRNVRVVWIGGGNYPAGGEEFNLSNDIVAANVVFRSALKISQIPMSAFLCMRVGFAELYEKVYPRAAIGKYLVEQLVAWDNSVWTHRPAEFHILGDSAVIGAMVFPWAGEWEWQPAPEFTPQMHYLHTGRNRPIRVYRSIDSRFVLEDFFAKLAAFAKSGTETGR